MAWERKLAAAGTMSQAKFARCIGVSGPTITRHLQLLRFRPEIRGFLLSLTKPTELRRFSLNRMGALARLNPEVQRMRWERMRVTQPQSDGCHASIGEGNPPGRFGLAKSHNRAGAPRVVAASSIEPE